MEGWIRFRNLQASPRAFGFAVCCLIVLAGCGPESNTPRLRITGASTVYPIVELAKAEFRDTYGVRLEAQAGGSTRGFEDTLAGRNDLGAMARELTEEESARVKSFPIAYDGVGIIVHGSNTVENLSTDDLKKIYRKEITNWLDVGGSDEKIVAVNKAEGHATLEVFLQHTGLDRTQIQADAVGGDNAQVIRLVANSYGAVGYVSMGEVIEAAAIGMQVRLVKLDGVEPTIDHVADESYPLRRTLYLVSKGEPSSNARQLIEFLHSDPGKQVITRGNYVPLP